MKQLKYWIAAIALTAGCQSAGGNGPEVTVAPPVEPAVPAQARMIKIPASDMLYGATEKNFDLLLATARLNFPGMKERLRRMQVIPPKPVSVGPFLIDEFEVTNLQFSEFLAGTHYEPSNQTDFLQVWKNGEYPDWAADFPVIWVSPEDAEAYCEWQGGRLPTDEEWERATRGGDSRIYPWGNDAPGTETTNIATDELEPIGNRPGDRSPFGVYDLGGNVSEITGTVVKFEGRPVHPIRGGSYKSGLQAVFAFQRNLGIGAGQRSDSIGFRCAADPN
jgi:formylglycine-generating enzyme required for sulfatase activity